MCKRLHSSKLWVAALLSALAASCVNIGDYEPDNTPQQVGFRSVVGLSRATTGLEYPTDTPFAATAYALPKELDWDTNKAQAIDYFATNKVEYNEALGAWVGSPAQYWSSTYSLTFFAHSPWGDNNGNKITNLAVDPTTETTTVTNWDTASEALAGIDLMIADVGEGQKNRTEENTIGGVPTVFRHVLSRVQVAAGMVSEYEVGGTTYHIYIRRAELRQIYTTGDYSSATGRWSSHGAPQTILLYDYTADSANANGLDLNVGVTHIGQDMLLLPQVHLTGDEGTQAEIYIEWLDTQDGNTKSALINLRNSISNSYWAPNTHYTYYLLWDKGDPSYIEFSEPTISEDWGDGGTYEMRIE